MSRTYVTDPQSFRQVLGEVRAWAEGLLAKAPDWEVAQYIRDQVEAMERWTEDGRVPTEDERRRIRIGTVVARELEPAEDEEREVLFDKIHELNGYFDEWPD